MANEKRLCPTCGRYVNAMFWRSHQIEHLVYPNKKGT